MDTDLLCGSLLLLSAALRLRPPPALMVCLFAAGTGQMTVQAGLQASASTRLLQRHLRCQPACSDASKTAAVCPSRLKALFRALCTHDTISQSLFAPGNFEFAGPGAAACAAHVVLMPRADLRLPLHFAHMARPRNFAGQQACF